MERHRHDDLGIGEELGAGAGHHGAERPAKLEPVAVFEAVDELAGDVVIARRGAGPLEHRRIGDRGRRQQGHAEIDRERRAEALAIGPLDELDVRPAAGAERVRLAGCPAAADAGRRIDDAEHRAGGAAAEAGGTLAPPGSSCFGLHRHRRG